MSDRERELVRARNFVPGPLSERIDRLADMLLATRAEEAERTKIDCTCESYWAQYGMRDPRCESHDLEDQQKARAAELRTQIGGKR